MNVLVKPSNGDIHHQNLDKNNCLTTICANYSECNIDKHNHTKYLTPSDFTQSQYTARNVDHTNNQIFPKTGDEDHLSILQLDNKNPQY